MESLVGTLLLICLNTNVLKKKICVFSYTLTWAILEYTIQDLISTELEQSKLQHYKNVK